MKLVQTILIVTCLFLSVNAKAALIPVYSQSFENGDWNGWQVSTDSIVYLGNRQPTVPIDAAIQFNGYINNYGAATTASNGFYFVKLEGSYSVYYELEVQVGDLIRFDYLNLWQGPKDYRPAIGVKGDDWHGSSNTPINGKWSTLEIKAKRSGNAKLYVDNSFLALKNGAVCKFGEVGCTSILSSQQLFFDNIQVLREVKASSNAVPEPNSIYGLLIGLTCMLIRRRRT